MTRRLLLNGALFFALLLLLALGYGLRSQPTRPNLEFLPQMVRTERYNTFSANPSFADGKTLQPAPPHAIARGLMPLPYTASAADARRAGRELSSPFSLTSERALERGARVYANFCITCHGPAGLGDGPVVKRGFPPPPSLLTGAPAAVRDGEMFHVLTYGKNNMSSYAAQLSRDDRWNVIAFVRSLQAQAAAPPPPASQVAAAPTEAQGEQP